MLGICRDGQNPARNLVVKSPYMSEFVGTWQVSNLQPKGTGLADAPSVTLKDSLGWRLVKADGNGFVNVHPLYDEKADGIVYLATEVKVSHEGPWTLLVGHDGGVRVFVDGKTVWTQPERMNPALWDRSHIDIRLSQGAHSIVVALDTDQGLGWGIFLRFEQPRGDRKPGVKPEFPEDMMSKQ
jgi:hypothetical protein